ncbi:rRNA adenine N-6-methyltransferase family protein [Prauserella halophila]|uniref:rRNA adenine N-6-methyltransferase family protein n=1 Tax=Prauserella halophila TaxID=185641 RepID=UPI0020A52745|nr:rRNA adenine N-6-methyltransferase family protein [Prauserella halophila]MCP2238667.1 Ribosomal RNA adenine dimethylase [Prauserella halophila]
MRGPANRDELHALADPALEQHFLVSPDKLTMLVDAAGIRPSDTVLEVGAGAGTVARAMPPCAGLTVVELDPRLLEALRRAVPHAHIRQGDALQLVHELRYDVLIGSLPDVVTESLIDLLPQLSFRTAVLATGRDSDFGRLPPEFTVTEITRIGGDDFSPPQPSMSRIVRVARRT